MIVYAQQQPAQWLFRRRPHSIAENSVHRRVQCAAPAVFPSYHPEDDCIVSHRGFVVTLFDFLCLPSENVSSAVVNPSSVDACEIRIYQSGPCNNTPPRPPARSLFFVVVASGKTAGSRVLMRRGGYNQMKSHMRYDQGQGYYHYHRSKGSRRFRGGERGSARGGVIDVLGCRFRRRGAGGGAAIWVGHGEEVKTDLSKGSTNGVAL